MRYAPTLLVLARKKDGSHNLKSKPNLNVKTPPIQMSPELGNWPTRGEHPGIDTRAAKLLEHQPYARNTIATQILSALQVGKHR